ncbi:MAG TPA: hypothetical protein VLM89_11625 [Phycisphaerae bacterium]|nr:hypothetical protein [Phycisphaerae bacterium]
MPVYVNCPHCDHPQVIASHRRGKALFCRQCGWVYQTSKDVMAVRPLAISTISELQERRAGGGKVFVIE